MEELIKDEKEAACLRDKILLCEAKSEESTCWSENLVLAFKSGHNAEVALTTSEEETHLKSNNVNVVEVLKRVDNTRIQKEVVSAPSSNAEHFKGNLCL